MMRARLILLAAAPFFLDGCVTAGADLPGRDDVAVPLTYAATLPPAGASLIWWEGFGDPVLDALIAQGLEGNLDVEAAGDRLRVADAFLRAERADRLPRLDAGAEAGVAVGDERDVTATAGLFGLFDSDISGRISAEIRAAAADYAEADYLLADRRRLVAAAIANQYVEYRRAGAQLELIEESTALQEETLRIVTLRFEAGLAANLDVRRASADLLQTRAQRGLIEISRAQAVNALAILLAEPSGTFAPSAAPEDARIPAYAGGPPAGIPADLLRRRSDILAAEARLVRAGADIGIERADLRPALTIPGNLVAGDGSLDGVFSDFLLTLGAALDIPLFDGGRRRAEVAAAEAEADARFAEYRATFLDALGEVENALVAIDANQERIEALEAAIGESRTALSQSNALYREGLASLFDVLDAQRQLIASRQSLIDSEAALASSFIAFHAATGS